MSEGTLKNQICYQIYYYAKKSLLLFYISTLYYLAVGLSYTNIAVISVVGTVATMLSEVPTGTISDLWSRKLSLQFAEVLKIVSLVLMLCQTRLFWLCLASLIWGLADSCQSGSDQALIYETFRDKEEYEAFLSKVYSRSYLVSAVATISATTLFAVDIRLPLVLSLALSLIALAAISFFEETRTRTPGKGGAFVDTNKKALACIRGEPRLACLLFLMSAGTLAIMFINSYTQPLLLAKGIDLWMLGVLMFGFNLCMSFGARLQKRFSGSQLHTGVALLIGVGAILIGAAPAALCVVAIAFHRILNGMFYPRITARLNGLLESDVRATVMSFQNIATSVLSMLFDPLVGLGLDHLGVARFYQCWGVLYLGVLLLFLWATRRVETAA